MRVDVGQILSETFQDEHPDSLDDPNPIQQRFKFGNLDSRKNQFQRLEEQDIRLSQVADEDMFVMFTPNLLLVIRDLISDMRHPLEHGFGLCDIQDQRL
ncbi:hypothetical protein WICPIJ_003370 [Wickerhamomyces pijperi]|uniref:Uncharacterized protein n=1 Tax=Wickerhamomyces pijperi TaxID=599730 RepID=A0A9P8Q7G9_WICPI|nr:hypothetical protein WICPIJ_003370 [Wickerhamomyces pijperi]